MRLLYCNCTYGNVIPPEIKREVLKRLSDSGVSFEVVADLCEMSARKDPRLQRLTESGDARIAACYPRAVRWLFRAGGADLPEHGVDILNMRKMSADDVVARLLDELTDMAEQP